MEELVRLIDEHTEYFRGHLEALPKSERRVYIAIMDLWQPSSTGEIAERARMDVRVVSTMLGRLIDRGAVMPDRWTGRKKPGSILPQNPSTASITSFVESATRQPSWRVLSDSWCRFTIFPSSIRFLTGFGRK